MIKLVELKRDQYILRGLHHENQDAKAIVVFFHGYTGHLVEHGFLFKQLSEMFDTMGIDSLRFDFMGSGISDGHFEEMTFQSEIEDAKAIINYALSIKGDKELYVLGFSMGGAVATQTTKIFGNQIAKLILFSPAGNMDHIARAIFTTSNVKRADDGSLDLGGFKLGHAFYEGLKNYDLYEGLDKFTNPVLIIHGELDQSVPIEYGRKYLKAFPNVKLHEVKGGDHGYNSLALRANAYSAVKEFLA